MFKDTIPRGREYNTKHPKKQEHTKNTRALKKQLKRGPKTPNYKQKLFEVFFFLHKENSNFIYLFFNRSFNKIYEKQFYNIQIP